MKKSILITILILILIIIIAGYLIIAQTSSPYYENKKRCSAAEGTTWQKEMGNGDCDCMRGVVGCATVLGPGCECGEGMCWNFEAGVCEQL